MYDKIVFYNSANRGDLNVSRTLVRFVTNNVPAKEYLYFCKSYEEKLLRDIKKLKMMKWAKSYMGHPLAPYGRWQVKNNILYVNTWYCAADSMFHNEHSTSMKTLCYIFRSGLNAHSNVQIKERLLNYIPDIGFRAFEINKAKAFLEKDKRKKVFICNCQTLSGQSENFDFTPIIKKLAKNNKDILFIITNGRIDRFENIVHVNDIVGKQKNLNECAFVSTYCDIVVGRGSGPFTFAINKTNILKRSNKFIYFTHKSVWADMNIPNLLSAPEKGRFTWSPDYSARNIYRLINEACNIIRRK